MIDSTYGLDGISVIKIEIFVCNLILDMHIKPNSKSLVSYLVWTCGTPATYWPSVGSCFCDRPTTVSVLRLSVTLDIV